MFRREARGQRLGAKTWSKARLFPLATSLAPLAWPVVRFRDGTHE